MKILFVTNMFPTKSNPVYGIFVQEQIEDIVSALNCKHDLYYINAKKKGKLMYLLSMIYLPIKAKFFNYDVIHIHYGISALFLLFFRSKSKVFLTLHGGDILSKQGKQLQVFLTKKILGKVDKVFILNREMEGIVNSLKVAYEILPCGVNTDFFTPVANSKSNKSFKLVLFPGNPLVEVKNYSLFEKTIQALIQKSNYTIEFQCIHNLSREGVRTLLNSADCLLMTSISEGSPQIIKEAICCGLPIVSVPVGDVKQMTESVPHCYVSDSYSPDELSGLVLKSFQGKGDAIRNAFINKNIYDSHSVTKRIIQNYNSTF